MQNDNKRKFSRILLDSPVFINGDGESWQSELSDISLNGVLVEKPADWYEECDGLFQLEIKLDGENTQIQMLGKVAHVEDDYIGFECVEIDLDSISSLKKLVLLNIGDEGVLERELSALAA